MYRYGIVSTASIVPRFVEGLRLAGDEVIAIASRDLSKASAMAQKLGIPNAYDSGNEFVYECRHIQSCIGQGLTESPVLPLHRSIEVVGYIEKLYRSWGMI